VTELSVVLVNHNGGACLPGALAALSANTEAEDVECIVVDSASADGSWEGVSGIWGRARALRFEDNIGFAAGCNRGAEAAAARLLAFVNFDGEVEPGWDTPLRALLDDPGVAVATGLLVDAAGETIEAAGLAIAPNTATFGLLEGAPRAQAPAEPVDVAAASGALMMVRRDEFLAAGGFYEPIFMYGEEAEYAFRVDGRIVLSPASAIRHHYGAAAGPARSRTRLYYGSRNRLVNAARHLPAGAMTKAVLTSAAFDVLTLAQLHSRESAGAIFGGWRDGLRALRRERRTGGGDRKRAAKRLVTLREAVAQQRRLGRV
jgi:GT2 family glycosyltransferase